MLSCGTISGYVSTLANPETVEVICVASDNRVFTSKLLSFGPYKGPRT